MDPHLVLMFMLLLMLMLTLHRLDSYKLCNVTETAHMKIAFCILYSQRPLECPDNYRFIFETAQQSCLMRMRILLRERLRLKDIAEGYC